MTVAGAHDARAWYLFAFIRERARQRWTKSGRHAARGRRRPLLDFRRVDAGFARRFAGYKRPELLFHDPERLARILNAAGRPVQVIFAGKAHPADEIGKHHLQRVYNMRSIRSSRAGGIHRRLRLHVAHFSCKGVTLAQQSASRSSKRHER